MLDVHNAGSYWRMAYISESPPAVQCAEEWRKTYQSFSQLPLAVQLAVAVLRMAKDSEKVEGVGRRVSETTFWLDDYPALLED